MHSSRRSVQYEHVAVTACAWYTVSLSYDVAHYKRCYLPGADDDGSGSVTILESYRALLSAGFRPERSVEFHWYAAEVRQIYVHHSNSI